MQTYELTYILSPEITSEEAGNKAKEIESAIQMQAGIIVKQIVPVAKTLSYQIKKHASGFFGVLEFQMEPEKLLEIKSVIEKDKQIVRHMVLIKKPVKIKKQRRSKRESLPTDELPSIEAKDKKSESKKTDEPATEKAHEGKAKVELKDIEQQLEEILGE